MEKNRIHPVSYGSRVRMSFAREKEILSMPNLLDIQKSSYEWFITEGMKEVFSDINPISDFAGNLTLEFIDFALDYKHTKSIQDAKAQDTTYSAGLNVTVRLTKKNLEGSPENETIMDTQIHMGDIPIMTENGTFVLNGAERVIVSQLVRSPGIYYSKNFDKLGKPLIASTVIPNRGAWLEYETDSNDVFTVRIDRTRKVPVTTFLRALGVATDAEIMEMFGENVKLLATAERDNSKSEDEGLIEVYKRLRPGEPPTVDSARSLLTGMFFDDKRYNLGHVGRYKYNKKLSLRRRVAGLTLAETVADPSTGEIIAESGEKLTRELCDKIQNTGIAAISVTKDDKTIRVLSNRAVDIRAHLDIDEKTLKEAGITEDVYYPALVKIMEKGYSKKELKDVLRRNAYHLIPRHITFEDIIASINYTLCLDEEIGGVDDIDHLGNRRIRCVGELLQNQFRVGLTRLERVVKERMGTQNAEEVTAQSLINIRPVTAAIKEFFGSSQLSQFMDQNNPLAEMTHLRRLSALGPGGLSRDRAGFEVRDVHHSHYGRMCPIETPEGPNIGLINSLATYARVNRYGFIEAPYRIIDKSGKDPVVTEEITYITADEEEEFRIAQANEPLDEKGRFVNSRIKGRFRDDNIEMSPQDFDMMDVSPRQVFSVAASLVPFLENDDASRALMGSNMQRQAVPLLETEAPVVATGMEAKTAADSGACIIAKNDGTVEEVDANHIRVKTAAGTDEYELLKFQRQNQNTSFNQRPLVQAGDQVVAGQTLADGPSTDGGELSLGKNALIGFMTWEGYNYEDAVLLSERLVAEDIYTSVHIEEYEIEAHETKLGPEEITWDIPNIGQDAIKDLDERGIIRIGAEVHAGDILVGKVTPKGETDLTAEERLLHAIFGEKAKEVRDTSLRVPHGAEGIVVEVKTFTRDNKDVDLQPGVNESVRVYIAHKRKISVGDKMAGRHGNKGVVSRVLPVEDMPFLPNGRPLDIVLNPLGVPSRMNIGQVLEVHLGLACKALGLHIATPIFDGADTEDIQDMLEMADDYVNTEWADFEKKYKKLIAPELLKYLKANQDHKAEWAGVPIRRSGKLDVRDGRTGEPFENPVTVGYMYYLKLHHLVDDKIHARSTGPYSLVTQQPLGGKAQFGGQRFGEMEVWALEAYGAAYTLQEILTVKSDDIVGRVKAYEAIVKGENIPESGVPESFKVLLKELQSLGLDMRVLTKDAREIEIREDIDDDGEPIAVNIEGMEGVTTSAVYYEDQPEEGDSYTDETSDDDSDELDFESMASGGFSVTDLEDMAEDTESFDD